MASSLGRRWGGRSAETRTVAPYDHLDCLAGGSHAGRDLGLVVALFEQQQRVAGAVVERGEPASDVVALHDVVLWAPCGRGVVCFQLARSSWTSCC